MAISICLSRPNCGDKQRMARRIEISNRNLGIASARIVRSRALRERCQAIVAAPVNFQHRATERSLYHWPSKDSALEHRHLCLCAQRTCCPLADAAQFNCAGHTDWKSMFRVEPNKN